MIRAAALRQASHRRRAATWKAFAEGEFGDRWPLTVARGHLRCEFGEVGGRTVRRVVFTSPDGTDYALSDAARWVGYASIAPIYQGARGAQYRNALTAAGAKLCRERS
jgi:hypothetical protein